MSEKTPTLAFDLDRDVRALSAMASNLTPYLYENEVYGYLAGDLPRLTLGGLLLRLHRLTQLENLLNAEQQNSVHNAQLNFESATSEWAVHYESKLQRELHVRLDAMEQFLHDCTDDPQGCVAGYPVEAEKRTMIKHLRDAAEERDIFTDDLRGRMRQLDNKLQRIFHEGRFIFADERLMAVYPREAFWWLHGMIGRA